MGPSSHVKQECAGDGGEWRVIRVKNCDRINTRKTFYIIFNLQKDTMGEKVVCFPK